MVQAKFSKEGGQKMSRDKIIQKIRQNEPESISLPESWKVKEQNTAANIKETFKERLKQAGAGLIELNGKEEIVPFIEKIYPGALDFGKQEVWDEYPSSCNKEKLNSLETVLIEGQLGVAENGAIWLDESNFPNRLIPFITQQLIIKLDSTQIVSDMHQAYRQINIENCGFGVFISGPSKTADIEQSLVYGAHGAKKLSVILY
jgi:L-lactate dehydrogenase complex protein LldG